MSFLYCMSELEDNTCDKSDSIDPDSITDEECIPWHHLKRKYYEDADINNFRHPETDVCLEINFNIFFRGDALPEIFTDVEDEDPADVHQSVHNHPVDKLEPVIESLLL